MGKSETGRILQLRTEIINLKLDEIRGQARKADKTSARPHFVQFEIYDFGSELQDSSSFRFPRGFLRQSFSVISGSTCSARIAGIAHALNPAHATKATAEASVSGSIGDTLKSSDWI